MSSSCRAGSPRRSNAQLANLEPARVGWGVIDDPEHTFCRRWIRRPDKMLDDPFGNRTVRANMHPGYQNPDAIAPSGPVDPALTVLSVQTRDGRPIAVLANYSMHYYGGRSQSRPTTTAGSPPRWPSGSAPEQVDPPFVGIMSQGTSGDQMWMDYGRPKNDPGLDATPTRSPQSAYQAYKAITYHDRVPLAMAETTLILAAACPTAGATGWARAIVAKMGSGDQVAAAQPAGGLREGGDFLHDDPVASSSSRRSGSASSASRRSPTRCSPSRD